MSFLSSVIRAPSKAAVQTAAARVASIVPSGNNPNFVVSSSSRHSSTSTSARKPSVSTTDLINSVAAAHEKVNKADAKRIISTLFDTIVETLKEDKAVHLSKFGSFETFTSKATVKRNPRTGEKVNVPEKKKIRFRAYKDFKETIAGETS